ncbi:MAG: helix-hairpin-helix domain-containing protein [Oligoflexia bacterium]|nr:helix-hairpin-helix domain-containing protein [Oligoflexia bacterium]
MIGIKNPISSLDLSNRAKSALLAEGIKTVEMLSSKTEKELSLIPNFGKTALTEVKTALAKKNLALRKPHSDLNSILSLDLSNRAKNALGREKIHTIEKLVSKTEKELMWMPNFGKKALEEVKQALAKRGLALKKARPNLDSILSLDISAYSLKILQAEEINTIEKLTGKTKQELMKLPYLSQRALWEIELSLAKRGLYLKDTAIH